ncbi:MAG: Arm DNA-binding domain-containing protein [Thiomonas sp.]
MSTLTDAQTRAAQPKAGKLTCLFDGGGLYLEITKAGSKGWRFKYRYGGVEKRLSFGAYPLSTDQPERGSPGRRRRQAPAHPGHRPQRRAPGQ